MSLNWQRQTWPAGHLLLNLAPSPIRRKTATQARHRHPKGTDERPTTNRPTPTAPRQPSPIPPQGIASCGTDPAATTFPSLDSHPDPPVSSCKSCYPVQFSLHSIDLPPHASTTRPRSRPTSIILTFTPGQKLPNMKTKENCTSLIQYIDE
jgi:hypothetical protein